MTRTPEEAKQAEPIRLDFQSVQQVVVTDKDGDRWVTTVREAANLSQRPRSASVGKRISRLSLPH